MLHLIIADAELELVPQEISSHRVIRWYARRKGRKATELILDSSPHHPAMKKLPEADRRGRPDIVHVCLLLALDSPLNYEGLLKSYVHTRHNKLIKIHPSTHIPRSYNRFVGLMEHLFLTGATPTEKPLLRLENNSLKELLAEIKPSKTISFSEKGQKRSWNEFFQGVSINDDVCIVVGGFPHGDFLSDVTGLSDEVVCVDPELLHASTVVTRAIYAYEDAYDVQITRLKR